jgi:phenylpropionate dioxygenase-like ring-hydroxylating dioxygenase large terminal subunit
MVAELFQSAEGRAFADAASVSQGWYLMDRSRALRAGKIRSVEVGPRRVLLYRDLDGRAHVTGDRCPHLGSDLALARVTRAGLRCSFHGWCWGADGVCTTAPQRRLRNYVTDERWGFIWAWLGDAPGFPLPECGGQPPSAVPDSGGPLSSTTPMHQLNLPPQRVRAHPDTAFANGFDLAHFGPSHGIEVSTKALEVRPPWQISHRIEGRLPYRPRVAWAGLGGAPLDATFEQFGGGIVQVHVRKPLDYRILFTIRPDANGHSRTRTILFLQHRRDVVRALALLWATALDDIPLMETIAWTRGFAKSDAVLESYVHFIEGLPQWR